MGDKPRPMGLEGVGKPTVSAATVVSLRPRSRKKVVLLVLLLVVALAVGAGYLLWQKRGTDKAVVPPTPQAQYKEIDNSIKTQFDEGDYQKTIQTINTYLATNPPQEYAKQVTIQQGSAYLNAKDYPSALAWYNKALAMSNTPFEKMASLHGLAATYESSGDKAAALEQYKAAYAIAKPLSATNDQALRLASKDERKIKLLGGTP